MKFQHWLTWRGTRKTDDAQRRDWACRTRQTPRRDGLRSADRWKYKPMTRFAFPVWRPKWAKRNGRRPFVALRWTCRRRDEEVASWAAAGTPHILRVRQHAGGIGCRHARHDQRGLREVGERALICSARTDFTLVPQSDHVKLWAQLTTQPPSACRAVVHHGGAGTTAASPACRGPHVDLLDRPRSDALGSSGQATESGCCPALLDHH